MRYLKVIVALLMLTLITACGCEHEWETVTCVTPKTCFICGESEGEALGHSWFEATCISAKFCERCGEIEGEPLGHNYVDNECTRCEDYIPLSNDCDMVLCTGYDGDNYYELVANQIDAYPDSTFEFGVIKNNEWLVEMSSKCPFLDSEGWWKGLDKEYKANQVSSEDFKYIGGHIFLYKDNLMYNPESGVFFENLCNRDYTQLVNYKEFIGFESYHEEGTANHYVFVKYFNTDTGDSKEVCGFFKDVKRPEKLGDISDGLFYASGDTWEKKYFNYIEYDGFFNTDGDMVLDLSEYKITNYYDYMYHEGEYTITCENNSGVKYDITFNKKGEKVKEERNFDY